MVVTYSKDDQQPPWLPLNVPPLATPPPSSPWPNLPQSPIDHVSAQLMALLTKPDPPPPRSSRLGLLDSAKTPSDCNCKTELSNCVMLIKKVLNKQIELEKKMSMKGEALGCSVEKSVQVSVDAFCARFLDSLTSAVGSFITENLTYMMSDKISNEFAAIAQFVSPVIEKSVSAAVTEAFQRGVVDKAVDQLERSVNSKLETTVARQIQAHFQTISKQAVQDALTSGSETSLISAVEKSCKDTLEQVDATFKKGMTEHLMTMWKQMCMMKKVAEGRIIEETVKAKTNADALWACVQEENARNEKLAQDRTQHLTNLITNLTTNDLPGMTDKILEELAAAGPVVANLVSPVIEKSVSSAVTDAFQGGVGDKAMTQLESSVSKLEAAVGQIQAHVQTTGDQVLQVLTMQKELEKQMGRMEQALERSVEESVEANADAVWNCVQAENAKTEKLAQDRTQHLTNLITNLTTNDLPTMIDKTLKELAAARPAVSHLLSFVIEKTVSSAVTKAFQRGLGDGAANQLEAIVGRQIKAQFQTTGKQAFQDTLQASSLAAGQKELLALATSNSTTLNDLATQLTDGPLQSLHEKVEALIDPRKELVRLISEFRYEDAFYAALQKLDVNLISWLCSQADLRGILDLSPMPLSQNVLLTLLQQLACDIHNDTSIKLSWMTAVAAAINPEDPMIAVDVQPVFEEVLQILQGSNLPENTNTRILMRVITIVLESCKLPKVNF